MNDNAHFFFFLLGFLGFIIFFVSTIIFSDVVVALVNGTIGCLGFAVIGRLLLSTILLSHKVKNPNREHLKVQTESSTSGMSEIAKNFTLEKT